MGAVFDTSPYVMLIIADGMFIEANEAGLISHSSVGRYSASIRSSEPGTSGCYQIRMFQWESG